MKPYMVQSLIGLINNCHGDNHLEPEAYYADDHQ